MGLKMAFTHSYAILQLRPFAHREELINVGLAVFRDDGLDVRLKGAPSILRHFGIEADTLDWAVSHICEHDDPKLPPEERSRVASMLAGIHFSSMGWFLIDSPQDYERRVESLLQQYVEKPKKPSRQHKRSKLRRDLAEIFKGYKLLSNKSEDLENHKIVPNMPVGPAGRLHIDFLLKNSSFHATETLDYRASDAAGEKEVKSAALVNVTFRHARATFSSHGTKCYLVYAAPSLIEKSISPALQIATDDADDVFNMESRDDKLRYLDTILAAAGNKGLFS